MYLRAGRWFGTSCGAVCHELFSMMSRVGSQAHQNEWSDPFVPDTGDASARSKRLRFVGLVRTAMRSSSMVAIAKSEEMTVAASAKKSPALGIECDGLPK